MNKLKNYNKTEDIKLPLRFIIIILLLIIYIIYVYLIGWDNALIYFTYFLLFLLFFNISINTNFNKEQLSKYHYNKCNDIKDSIEKLKKQYNKCIFEKNLSLKMCKNGSYEYKSKLLNTNQNYVNLNNFDNIYELKNVKFPFSNEIII